MEQSAYEAVMIGVNVFVFIIALTAAVLLMSNVINMVNFANERAIVGMNGTLAESVGVVNERVYTGSQMLTYYREQLEIRESDKAATNYIFKVRLDEFGQEKDLETYIQNETLTNYLNREFILEYKGETEGKHTYVFSLKNIENTEI